MNCKHCGHANPTLAKFCMNCGNPLEPLTAADDQRLTRLTSGAPPGLARQMRAAAHLVGERRVVTALFADVVGSTQMAEGLDPEAWAGLMNRAFDQISKPIYHYEGSIARLMGDSILAFFGAPVAHEDDPIRAIHAALDILAAAREFARTTQAEFGLDFQMRVGINTGQVVVGEIGSDLKFEYTAMGDAVNLAARMQTAAAPGSALITEETYRFVHPVFDVVAMGPLEVRGKSEPVNVYEVVGRKARLGRLRGLENAGISSPLIGREKELASLLSASDMLPTRKPQYVAIIGEAGLGKSRLVAEWREHMTGQGRTFHWFTGQCLSYGQGLAYHLLLSTVRSTIGVQPSATSEETEQALIHTVDSLDLEAAEETLTYLSHLLSVGGDMAATGQLDRMDPQLLQAQYLRSIQNLLRGLSRSQPVYLILEDIHWSDPSSTELLTRLFSSSDLDNYEVLICVLSRPDYASSGWRTIETLQAKSSERLSTIELTNLGARESRMLISSLLEIEALPAQTRESILSKTEGNPFFMEEVVRMLIDQGVLAREGDRWVAQGEIENIQIPDTLQGLLLARIDQLPEECKRMLRVASVIGRQFAVRVLDSVLERA
jgi:class 3 adenylate cyclase